MKERRCYLTRLWRTGELKLTGIIADNARCRYIFTYLPPELTVRGNISASKDVCRPRQCAQDSVLHNSVPKDSVPQVSEPQVIVTLTEADIPGALLNEPLEAHNVAALKWWLFCHDLKLPSSCRKRQVIQN